MNERVQRFLDALSMGRSLTEIGSAENPPITKQSVSQILKKAGISPRDVAVDVRSKRWASGLDPAKTAAENAAALGVVDRTIWQRAKRHGVKLKRARPASLCGTMQRYSAGCRCDECRAANTAYYRSYRERRRNRQSTRVDS